MVATWFLQPCNIPMHDAPSAKMADEGDGSRPNSVPRTFPEF